MIEYHLSFEIQATQGNYCAQSEGMQLYIMALCLIGVHVWVSKLLKFKMGSFADYKAAYEGSFLSFRVLLPLCIHADALFTDAFFATVKSV